MMELLEPLEDGTCKNCGGEIKKLKGESTGEQWYHYFSGDGSFRRECPGTKYAEPR